MDAKKTGAVAEQGGGVGVRHAVSSIAEGESATHLTILGLGAVE